jgi:hypothetical protein
MTIEIRQLVIKAVVESQSSSSSGAVGRPSADPIDEAALVSRCTRAVLQALQQMNER